LYICASIKPCFIHKKKLFCGLLIICLAQAIYANPIQNEFRDSLLIEIGEANQVSFFTELIPIVNNNGKLGKWDKLEVLDAAIVKTNRLGFKLAQAKLEFTKSIYKTIEGDYGAALLLLQPNLSLFEKESPYYAAQSYNTMGNMVDRLGDKALAIAHLKKAIKLTQIAQIDEATRTTQHINNNLVLGSIYFRHERLDSAEYYYRLSDSLAFLDSSTITKEKCFCLTNLASLEFKKGNHNISLRKCKAAIQLASINNYPDIIGLSHLHIGNAYEALGKYDSAKFYFQLAEKIVIQNGLAVLQLSAIKQLSQLYRTQGLNKKAIEELDRYQQVKIELERQNKSARAAYIIAQTQKEEKVKAAQNLESIQQEESQKRRDLLLLFAIILGSLTAILLVVLRLRKQRKLLVQEKLEKQIISGQLKALSAQMNPHFIFNSLNSIQDLILKQDATKAYDNIGKFAMLIRKILHHSEKEFIDIEDEFKILKLYLELEELRFKDQFKYQLKTGGIKDIEIPPMLIQPFVENAIKHGLLHKKGNKELELHFELKETYIEIQIRDNGIGRKRAQEIKDRQKRTHHSFAGQSMNKRLEILKSQYGGDFKVSLQDLHPSQKDSGTLVTICSPYRRKY